MTMETHKTDNKRYRYYFFNGHKFPGELITIDFVAQSRIKRILTLEECPILGECVLCAVVKVEYDATPETNKDNHQIYWRIAQNKTISWSIERGLPISEVKPWKEHVEKAILNSDSFKSLVGATQDTSCGIHKIKLPYHSWTLHPIYTEDVINIYSIPILAIPLIDVNFWEQARSGKLDKPEPGDWEKIIERASQRVLSNKDRTMAFGVTQ